MTIFLRSLNIIEVTSGALTLFLSSLNIIKVTSGAITLGKNN